jgi:hypothetical protein
VIWRFFDRHGITFKKSPRMPELERERAGGNPWQIVDALMNDSRRLESPTAKLVTAGLRKGWKSLGTERRALLELLSRCAISEAQALRIYDNTAGRRRPFFLADCCSQIRGDDGARAIDDVGWRRRCAQGCRYRRERCCAPRQPLPLIRMRPPKP